MRFAWAVEIGMLLIPIMLLSVTTGAVYRMCFELGISMIYAEFPPI